MTDDQIQMLQAELQELHKQCANLRDNAARLLEEKYKLRDVNKFMSEANERLAIALKAVIAEKGELEKQLKHDAA